MPRDIDSTLMAALSAPDVSLCVLAMLTFATGTEYVWSGVGNVVWNGNTFTGVGSLGRIAAVKEGSNEKAQGTSVQLSGLDPAMLGDAVSSSRVGAPATLWLGAFQDGAGLVGTPYTIFVGQMDKPSIKVSAQEATIAQALETLFINHARASQRRYTAADQHANGYSDDIAFNWVETLNDQALVWGTSN